jgi:hypothetical protein
MYNKRILLVLIVLSGLSAAAGVVTAISAAAPNNQSWPMISDLQTSDTDMYPPAPVPQTGQVISYTVGDDGNLTKGVAWPNPRFTDNEDGTIKDNLTGLIWLKKANCGGTMSWSNALTFTHSLYDGWTGDGSGGDCGLSDGSEEGDWRLPNVQELQSLVHYGVYDPAIPNTAGTGQWTEDDPFNDVQSYNYWTSTTYATDISQAWDVVITIGRVNNHDKGDTHYVWPVRDSVWHYIYLPLTIK